MYYSGNPCISAGEKYVEELDWWLVPVHGVGKRAKVPIYQGWPDVKPGIEHLQACLDFHGDAGIGINLGGSGLIDLEGDSEEGEAILTDLCKGLDFPRYKSSKSIHRLFQVPDSVGHLDIRTLAIEFRTGRHQSILPPSTIDDTQYKWIVDPFDCPPPPLPEHIIDFYNEHKKDPANKTSSRKHSSKSRWPYRDRFGYILSQFDLMEEAKKAGLEFAMDRADQNGNVPCYVPELLRGGNSDDHASGVFNVLNGVLRDFATNTNHPFFRVMAALTGEPWQELVAHYESNAKKAPGRPHSRRVSYPTEHLTDTDRTPLNEARGLLSGYFEEQLSREVKPKTLHVIKGPPGLGKTYTLCKKLGEKDRKATILTLENKLATHHDEIINDIGGGNAQRMPVLRETACPHPNEYEATARRGFKPSQSYPCRKCPIGPSKCPYLLAFSSIKKADQLCAAAIYHVHDGFYEAYGNEDRPILVLDENCVDLLLEPVSFNLSQWQAWGKMLRRWEEAHDHDAHPHTGAFYALIEWIEDTAEELLNFTTAKFMPYRLPELLFNPTLEKLPSIENWFNRVAFKQENRQVHNLYRAALYLLTTPDANILLERIRRKDCDVAVVRFRKKNPLPENKEVFMLDATANEELIRAIAPDWNIKVWECPPIEQLGRVVQIMDYDISRNRIKREVKRHESHNPSWLVQVIDNILSLNGAASIITFKSVVDNPAPELNLLGLLKYSDKIVSRHNFPCRGHTFEEDNLIILGTPYKDEATIWELAIAIWGFGGLPRADYAHRSRENGYFISETMTYGEPQLRTLEDFIVTADLAQAIGRVRPLQRESTIFVITNAPLGDWEVEQFTAAELFDVRLPAKKDAAENYLRVSEVIESLLNNGDWVKLSDVLQSTAMKRRTVANYWKQYQENHQSELIIKRGMIRRA